MPMRVVGWVLSAGLLVAGCATSSEPLDDEDDDAAVEDDSTIPAPPNTGSPAAPNTSTPGSGNNTVGLPPGCWNGAASCNPLTNDGCGTGEACDAAMENGMPALSCFPPPNGQGIGEPCDIDRGPFCAGGSTCVAGACAAMCCSAAECSNGLPCSPIVTEMGTLGACAELPEAPECGAPGAFCTAPSDCCSNDCHIDHCH
ncbi:MAG: hypothetical protein AAGA56_30375 [Myxococcota bacterium]